jgi:hypothetical protein
MVRRSAMAQALLPVHGASRGGRLDEEKMNRKAKVNSTPLPLPDQGVFIANRKCG